MNNEPVAWEGAEEWEHLAWELCADEHGEESCHDLIWDMGVIPEPWGERWQKYEDEAKRMIFMVRKCTHPAELTDEEIIESLAELEHEQWMKWADTIMQTEKISDSRFARWASCMIPYSDLTEEMKEFDRVWARKALVILRKAQEK